MKNLFQPFDPKQPATITGHHLPHWTQPGCTYFVTFRLQDSLPASFAEAWYRERKEWLRRHGINTDEEVPVTQAVMNLPASSQEEYHERFSHVMERKLDDLHGSCLLREDGHRLIVERSLRYFHDQRYRLGAFAILPNHVHALVSPQGTTLKSIVYSWKHWTATRINLVRGKRGAVWQPESFDHIVRRESQLEKLGAYIARNPARAGLGSGFTIGHGDDRSSPGTP